MLFQSSVISAPFAAALCITRRQTDPVLVNSFAILAVFFLPFYLRARTSSYRTQQAEALR